MHESVTIPLFILKVWEYGCIAVLYIGEHELRR